MARPWGRKAAVVGATLLIASLGTMAPTSAVENGGNRDCNAGFTTLKYDGMPTLGDVYTDGTLTVTVTGVDYKADGSMEIYGFSADITGASTFYVIVKGGPTSIRHSNGQTTDLDTRLGPGGRHYGISNVKFCYKV
jgi:hypothetical protein